MKSPRPPSHSPRFYAPAVRDIRLAAAGTATTDSTLRGRGDAATTPGVAETAPAHTRGNGGPLVEETGGTGSGEKAKYEEGSAQYIEKEDGPFETFEIKTAGSWMESGHETCNRKPFNFGIVCGNWGPDSEADQAKKTHMQKDIFNHPGHVLCAQEMGEAMCTWLKGGWNKPDDGLVRDNGMSTRKQAKDSPKQSILVFSGKENRNTRLRLRELAAGREPCISTFMCVCCETTCEHDPVGDSVTLRCDQCGGAMAEING